MMKKKWIWIVAAILIVLLIVLLIIPKKKRVFNTFEFPETVMVTNGTEYRADTVAMVLANKVFEMDTIDLKIFYLPDVVNEGDMEFKGIVQKLPFGPHKYLLLLNKNMRWEELLIVISHEFIHIQQYESGRLIINGKDYWWEGEHGVFDTYNTSRPFEKEAFSNQNKIKKELTTMLYE
jgi:hypothetical protein